MLKFNYNSLGYKGTIV